MNPEEPNDSELFNTMGLILVLTLFLSAIQAVVLWFAVTAARQPHNQFEEPRSSALVVRGVEKA